MKYDERSQGVSSYRQPAVYVGPEKNFVGSENTKTIAEAVRRGGGEVCNSTEQAEAVVWLGESHMGLSEVLHPGVRWVQLRSAGIEGFLSSGLLDDRRTYTAAQGAYAGTVAEHALALMLAASRRLHECARATEWPPHGSLSGRVLAGSTVAILGCGGIGQELVRLLEPFGVKILAVTRSGRYVEGALKSLAACDMHQIWSVGDFFVVAAPSTADTRHMIGARELAAMQAHAWVINVARGPLVDTEALLLALREGTIGGAALDVTDPEPLPREHPLWTESRVLITPHSSNPLDAFVRGLAQRVEENVERFITGQEMVGTVDPRAGY